MSDAVHRRQGRADPSLSANLDRLMEAGLDDETDAQERPPVEPSIDLNLDFEAELLDDARRAQPAASPPAPTVTPAETDARPARPSSAAVPRSAAAHGEVANAVEPADATAPQPDAETRAPPTQSAGKADAQAEAQAGAEAVTSRRLAVIDTTPLETPTNEARIGVDDAAAELDTATDTEPVAGRAAATESRSAPAGLAGHTPEAAVIAHLRAQGKLSDGDLARARKLAEDGGDPLRSMLVRLGLVSDRDMAAAYARVLDLERIDAEDYPDAPVAEPELSLRFLKDVRMVPLREDGDVLELAVADPVDSSAVQAVEMAAGRRARLRVGLPTEIDAALERLYETPEPGEPDTELDADLGNFSEEDIEHLRDLASEAPVIRLVNQIMQRAVESRASDVHIEPFADELKVRYRIDGILKETESPPVRSTAAVISRIKIMAKLNIAERRLPQDGRIPLRVQGKELDLRVSTVPTMFGESVVMRLLDKESVRFDFDALGFDGPPRERVLQILDQPYGIFLVTGPTGSGKSTTLYTALSRLNTEARKIITVEDPVEYQVPGINQIPVKASIGMTFAHALRAIVRQDPDVIMVGEMRDLETARIAVQSALTGHVVLSTLHTNDAASGVTRLLDMGVEDYLLTSTINGILAQRLVRRLCPDCREPFRPRPEMAARFLNLPGVDDSDLTLYHPRGCDACQGSGYRGRLVIAEVLMMTDRIRQAVLKHATATEIQRIAIEQDMLTMYQDGLRKAAAGHTTVEEVLRVASVADD
jgi:general secretion pathway protein E